MSITMTSSLAGTPSRDGWQEVSLGNLLEKSQDFISLEPSKSYQGVTVRLWGKGAVSRGWLQGSEISAPRMLQVRPGQFIMSRIDARNGAAAVVPQELERAVVSNDFPVFTPRRDLVLPEYLGWYCKTHAFVDLCKQASEGTTNRVRLKEERFLAAKISLPPLEEQRRIVARVEELAAKAEEARRHRDPARQELEALVAAIEMQVWPDSVLANAPTLEQVTTFLSRGRQSEQGPSGHFLIKTQHVQMGRLLPTAMTLAPHVASAVKADAKLRRDDILIACSAAGCIGRVAQYAHEGQVVSTDTHVAIARPNPEVVLPTYLYAYLKGAQGQFQLRSRERGDWQRAKIEFRLAELNLADLKLVPVPVPSKADQESIVGRLKAFDEKISKVRHLQDETEEELSALVPSILSKAFKGEL